MSESDSPSKDDTKENTLILSFEESRVLGSLLEKEVTTPDQYPLTFNSLVSACNQLSSRFPVTDFDTPCVEKAMEGLRYKKLSFLVHQSGARVVKCKHTLQIVFPYIKDYQKALLCVLMLRGRQTTGELRQRVDRMHSFESISKVEEALEELINYTPKPLVVRIPPNKDKRVVTFMHLLCGEVDIENDFDEDSRISSYYSRPKKNQQEEIESLKEEIESLKMEIKNIKNILEI